METIINKHFRNGLQIKLTATFEGECPNNVYGNFRQVDNHQGGVTVQIHDRHGVSYWEPLQYSIADLSKDYAKAGEENPSKRAYESLKAECEADVLGDMVYVELSVSFAGIELASDGVGTQYYHEWKQTLEETAREVAADHFNIRQLIRDARQTAGTIGQQMEAIAK